MPELTEQEELAQTFNDLKSALENQQEYVRRSLAMCKEDPNFLDIASYQLQECEQFMRSLIAVQPMLPKEQKIETAKAYAALQTLSETVQDAKSDMVWKEYCEKEWTPFIDKLKILQQWSTDPTANKEEKGVAEQRILLIQKQMSKLQQILPKLSEKYIGDVNKEYPEDPYYLKKIQRWMNKSSNIRNEYLERWRAFLADFNSIQNDNEEQRIVLVMRQIGDVRHVFSEISEQFVDCMDCEYSIDVPNAAVCLRKCRAG